MFTKESVKIITKKELADKNIVSRTTTSIDDQGIIYIESHETFSGLNMPDLEASVFTRYWDFATSPAVFQPKVNKVLMQYLTELSFKCVFNGESLLIITNQEISSKLIRKVKKELKTFYREDYVSHYKGLGFSELFACDSKAAGNGTGKVTILTELKFDQIVNEKFHNVLLEDGLPINLDPVRSILIDNDSDIITFNLNPEFGKFSVTEYIV